MKTAFLHCFCIVVSIIYFGCNKPPTTRQAAVGSSRDTAVDSESSSESDKNLSDSLGYLQYVKQKDSAMAIIRREFQTSVNPYELYNLFKSKGNSGIVRKPCENDFAVKLFYPEKKINWAYFPIFVLQIGKFKLINYNGALLDTHGHIDSLYMTGMLADIESSEQIYLNNRYYIVIKMITVYGLMATHDQGVRNELLVYEIDTVKNTIRNLWYEDDYYVSTKQVDDFNNDGVLDVLDYETDPYWGITKMKFTRNELPKNQYLRIDTLTGFTSSLAGVVISQHYLRARMYALNDTIFEPVKDDAPFKKEWIGFNPTNIGDSLAFQVQFR